MQQPVDDYNKKLLSDGAMSWNNTQKFFIAEDLKTSDNFQALSQAGISSAHNAITDKRIDQLQSHTSTLIKRNATYDKALTDLALVVNSLQDNQGSAPTPAPAASAPPTDMQTILVAITNLQQPTCPVVPPKPKTELQQILALLTANAGNKNSGGGGGGNGSRRNNNNNGGGNNNNNNGGGNNNNNNNGGGNNNNTRSKGRKVSTTPNIRY